MGHFLTIIKPALVLSILLLFVLRLLLVAFYQQRSGDYFSNKMFYRYSKMEIYNCAVSGRRPAMRRANIFTTLLVVLSILLFALVI